MANESLQSALTHAGLSLEAFADAIGVDPKSASRWVSGHTTPYPRHRNAIARALDATEFDLWPHLAPGDPPNADSDPGGDPDMVAGRGVGDVTGTWAHPDQPGAPDLVALINTTDGPVDILDPYGRLEVIPGILELLAVHAAAGRTVRVLTGQDTPGYGTLADAPGIEIAAGEVHMDTWLIQAGGRMIAGINLPSETLQFTGPLIELDATILGGLAQRLQGLFEELWETAAYTYASREADGKATTTEPDGNATAGEVGGAIKQPGKAGGERPPARPPAHGPPGPSDAAVGTGRPRRRWPGRTD